MQSNPGVFIDCFLEIYPHHKADDFIKCGQVQELRQHMLKKLVNAGVTVIEGEPNPIEPVNRGKNGFKVNIATPNGQLTKCFGSNTKFLNWHTEFEEHGLKDVLSIPHTFLYKKPFESIHDNIILVGDNFSAAWFVDHLALYIEQFPNKFTKKPRVYYIGTQELPRTITTSKAKRDLIELIKIDRVPKNQQVSVLEETSEYVKITLPLKNEVITGRLYAASGIKPALRLTQKIRNCEKLTKLSPDITKKMSSSVFTKENPLGSLLLTTHLLQVLLHQTDTILPAGVYIKKLKLPTDYHEMISAFHQVSRSNYFLIF